MLLSRSTVAMLLSAVLLVPPTFASSSQRAHTTSKAKASSHSAKSSSTKTRRVKHKRVRRSRGQQKIDTERATQIQEALIRQHYLSGEPSGNWDAASITAMQKYQADQGWQTKLMPDSRALKKLGLGPDYSSAINAKGSSFASPPPEDTIPTDQVAGFAAAAGVSE